MFDFSVIFQIYRKVLLNTFKILQDVFKIWGKYWRLIQDPFRPVYDF